MRHEDAAAAVQRRQHGLITLDQALCAGMTAEQVRDRHRRGLWTVERPGVYAPAGAPPTAERAVLAAVLASQGPTYASHATAGWLWRVRGVEQPDRIELVRPLGHHPRMEGVAGHRSGALFSADLTTRLHIPITTPERTVIDQSGRFSLAQLGRIVDDGLRRGIIDLERLRRCAARLHKGPGRRLAVVHDVLGDRILGYNPGDSDFETDVLRAIVAEGLPPPVQQYRVRIDGKTYRLDLALPEPKAAFELDSWKYHGAHSSFTDDRVRDNILTKAGWHVYHFTDRMPMSQVVETYRAVLEEFAQSVAA